jgi:ABC-type amino acid transport substrate-binding protein/serine phosphatase RsbU (regulator of sigma subunit)
MNNHVGILADLLGHIKKISGLELKEIPSNSWSEAVKKIKNNQADMYSGIGVTPEKLKTMNFTKNNILKVPYVFVSRKGEEYLKGFDSLNGKKIAVIENYTINTLLKQHYPKLKINLMKNPKKGFQLLQNKDIDVMIVNSATANYFIKKLGFNDLHISYTTNLTLELKIAINKNIPKEAISIINKAIERINSKLISDAFFKYTNSGGLFNNNEERYLAKKKTLKICTNPTWEPIEFTSNNITQGISLDILDSMKTQLGLKYEFIKTNSWEQSQNFLKNKKCDILPSAIKTAKRKTFANFTDPYLKYDLVIITHKDLPEVSNIDYIIHKKMSRREGSGLISRLKKQYPKIDITETKSTLKSFELVNDKSVDFTISTLPVFLYHKKKYDLKNIKLAGYTPMKYNLSIAVRKDDKQLLNILDKVLKNVPESTIKLVHDKWATPKTIQTINWTLMLQVFVVFIIVLLIVIYWARKLNIAKKAAEVARIEANKAKKEVEAMHKHTRESIEYAALLQDAILPDNKIMEEYFSDYFIHWMPKDTVGGDIWLFDRLRTKDECLLFYIDCTGHGVPGAFVTMIVKAVEREIVAHIMDNPQMDISPAWVMGYFNRAMKTLLKQDNKDSKSNAGWDGGIIYYNKKEKILKFAGAETPLFYINNDGELTTLKGNRYSVGYKKCDMDYQYKETIIEVEKGMKFYCTTDGYLDQNGGKKDFPFGKKRFSNIIKNNFTLTMKEQKKIFLKEIKQYESYIQNNERNDDMTVIAFEI